ncbi:MAG TPA: hypothetical protein VN711_03295, partial [Candidatus Saccharimonadales bacterium]|nr:hypothetical protein [Candidatus Saccharimonadales bacterium]
IKHFRAYGTWSESDVTIPALLNRPDIAARLNGPEIEIEACRFGSGAQEREYVTVVGEDGKKYIFPKENPLGETRKIGEAALLVPTESLAKGGWLPDPATGYLAFAKNGPKSWEAFLQFVQEHGMYGDRSYFDPISKDGPQPGEKRVTHSGDSNFLQIIPVGVQRDGLGRFFTGFRKAGRALEGLGVPASVMGHVNDRDTGVLVGAGREADEEMVTHTTLRRGFKLPWAKRLRPVIASYSPFADQDPHFRAIPRGLAFAPNTYEGKRYNRGTAQSPESGVHIAVIFDIESVKRPLLERALRRVQVGIKNRKENKFGVYLSKGEYRRWERGFDLENPRDRKRMDHWLKRWKSLGYVPSETTITDLPTKLKAADWNSALMGEVPSRAYDPQKKGETLIP